MQLIRLRLASILLFLILMKKVDGETRPELLLRDLLTKPFVPQQFASLNCIRDSKFYLDALSTQTPWALKMYDASVKIPSGVITGNIKQLGNFDECVGVESDHGFTGQACYVDIMFDLIVDGNNTSRNDLDLGDLLINVAIASNATKWTSGKTVPYQWMWCVPSTCKHSEIQKALEIAFDHLKVEGRLDFEIIVHEKACYTVESIHANNTLDIGDYLFITVFLLCVMLCIGATLVMKYMRTRLNQLAYDNIKAFCLYTNGKNLFSTEKKDNSIDCIHGLRFLAICWIVYGHTYYMETTSATINLSEIPHMHYDWTNMLILNANIATDIFFLLSGILSTYTELKKNSADINWNLLNVLNMYSMRYIRLTPPYAIMIFFYSTLFRTFGMGPQWHSSVHLNSEWCRKNWWTNLLYINNFINVAEMCMSQSWYLAVDMQIYLVITIIRYMMYKLPKFWSYPVMCCLLFLSILITFFITFDNNLTGTMLYYKNLQDVSDYYQQIYVAPYARFGPYIVGAILGYILHNITINKIKLPLWGKITGWVSFVIITVWVIFYPNTMYYDTHKYNKWEASIYAALHRPLLAVACSWVILCCENGYAGLINDVLSWRGFISLSKLTYGIYLVHYVPLLTSIGAVRTSTNLTRMDVLEKTIVILAFSIPMAAILYLMFEMPCMNIGRILFSKRRISNDEPTTTNGQNVDITKSEESSIPATLPIQMCDNNNDEQCVGNISENIDCSMEIDENHENGNSRSRASLIR